LRDRSIKIEVWGLKAWIPAIFRDFFHIEDDVILKISKKFCPSSLKKRGGTEFFRMKKY
jgi:hypothetical protein